jgi:hypothetical protein
VNVSNVEKAKTRNKPKCYSILLIAGAVLLLVSSCLIDGGCWHNKEVEEPELGPLESPFSEIIPSAEDLFISPYYSSEETIYYSDGLIGYSRMFGNESASYSSLSDVPKPESPPVILSMLVYEYQDEGQAMKRIQEEKTRKWYDESDTEFYAKLFELPPEDITGHVVFWEEPTIEEIQGEEVIFFRIGQYVGNYQVHVHDPPELSDGYFMPPELHDLLESAVSKTISKLRSL